MTEPLPDSAALGELMHAAFRGLRKRWMHQLAPYNLTPHQFRAVSALGRMQERGHAGGRHEVDGGMPAPAGEAEAEGIRLKELAERLHIAPRSATEVVDQLAAKGLVARRPHPRDRRATLLSLTEDGQALRARVKEDRKREADEFFSVLEPADRAELGRILGLLA